MSGKGAKIHKEREKRVCIFDFLLAHVSVDEYRQLFRPSLKNVQEGFSTRGGGKVAGGGRRGGHEVATSINDISGARIARPLYRR